MLNLLLQLVAASFAFAADADSSAVVKSVDVKNRTLSLEAKDGTQAGDRWIWSKGDESCLFQVYVMRGSVARARSEECESVKKIKKGETLTLSATLVAYGVPESAPVAQEPSASDRRKISRERKNPELPTDNESWYLLAGGGVSANSYQGEFKDTIKALDDLDGKTSSFSFSINLGVYWPISNRKTILGGHIEGTGDAFSNKQPTREEKITISQRLISFSAMHFFGQNVGDGWFLRGDLGAASALMTYDTLYLSAKSKSGYGLIAGGGYAIPIGDDTRVLLFLNLSSRHFGSERFTVSTLGADFLF